VARGTDLNFEVLSEWNEDVPRLLEIFIGGHAGHVHCQCDREVEGVKCGLVFYDKGMFFQGELGEVDGVFWGG